MPDHNNGVVKKTVVMYYPCEHIASIDTKSVDYSKVVGRTHTNVKTKVPGGIPIVRGYACGACEIEKIRKDPELARANGYLVTTYRTSHNPMPRSA